MGVANILIGEKNYSLLSDEEKKEWKWFDEYTASIIYTNHDSYHEWWSEYSWENLKNNNRCLKIECWKKFCEVEEAKDIDTQVYRKFFKSFPKSEEKKWEKLFVNSDVKILKGADWNKDFKRSETDFPKTATLVCGDSYYYSLDEKDREDWIYAYRLNFEDMSNEEYQQRQEPRWEDYEWCDGIFKCIKSMDVAAKLAGEEDVTQIETVIYCKRYLDTFTYKDKLHFDKVQDVLIEEECWLVNADGLSDKLWDQTDKFGVDRRRSCDNTVVMKK